MRTEAGNLPESLVFPIRNGLGASNDRFGFKVEVLLLYCLIACNQWFVFSVAKVCDFSMRKSVQEETVHFLRKTDLAGISLPMEFCSRFDTPLESGSEKPSMPFFA